MELLGEANSKDLLIERIMRVLEEAEAGPPMETEDLAQVIADEIWDVLSEILPVELGLEPYEEE